MRRGILIMLAALPLLAEMTKAQPVFAPPVNLGPTINTSAVESDPFWDGPRNRLYFVRDFDIWYADWNGTSWNTPIKLGLQINSGAGIEQSPSVSPDGQQLYFISDARQGFLWDIWVSTWDSSINDWGAPVNVGYPVNTPGVEFSAHLAPDGVHLYFDSSDGPDSLFPFGRYGIYVSERNGSSWTVPIFQWDYTQSPEYPSVTADGQWLYFSGISEVFVSQWTGSTWGTPHYNLRQNLGGRGTAPFITASGDSLFFAGATDFVGFGGRDIYMAKLIGPSKIPSLTDESLIFLVFVLTGAGIYWTLKRNP